SDATRGEDIAADKPQDNGGPRAQLAKRAFDLSTMLLSAPANGQNALQQPQQQTNSTASPIRPIAHRPSLASAVSDLKLIQEVNGSLSIASADSRQTDAQLVLMNAIATVHAHTVEQLLAAALPLPIDMEYWSSHDDNPLSLAVFFIQSLPSRLYSWGSRLAAAALELSTNGAMSSGDLLNHLYAIASSKLLFPDLISTVPKSDYLHDQTRLRLTMPKSINILSLTRREIRHKQRHLLEAQERLASLIGQLSQAAINGATLGRSISPETLLVQIAGIVSEANTSSGAEAPAQPPMGVDMTSASDIATLAKNTEALAGQAQDLAVKFTSKIQKYRRPPLLIRAWLPALAAAYSAKYLSEYIAGHQEDFKEWLAGGAVTLQNYVAQYIIMPLRSAYETIRYGKYTYSVATKESLASDFKSLEDMVVGFAARLGAIDAAAVQRRVETGDLSDVMQVYTKEMQQPLRNLVFGDLVEAMLIQVQKVKVDVGQTMAALDKLLKSNELNFLLLSTVPASLTILSAFRWLSSAFSRWVNGSSRHATASIQLIMRDIDRLLNIDSSTGT
ncbi:Intraflagellar transport protein 88, partial [Dipsacomyces acuminosporus]